RVLSRVSAAVNHAVKAIAIAVAGDKIAEFQAVDGDAVCHLGDPADEELTGLVTPDRITVTHDLLELAQGIRHPDGTDDSAAERGVGGRHTREDRYARNRAERRRGGIGADAEHRAGRLERLL